jgi:hypothetical protein
MDRRIEDGIKEAAKGLGEYIHLVCEKQQVSLP